MYIGIDLGGTNIAAGLVDDSGAIIERAGTVTAPERGTEAVIDDMMRLVQELAAKSTSEPAWIGIGSPGSIDSAAGVVIYSSNLMFKNLNIRDKMRCGFPVFVGNDANAAALGEFHAGAAKDCDSAVMITLGTGIGGGIIIDNRLYEGFNGCAGELGHTVIVKDGRMCGCGRRGCWEAYSSATGLKAMTAEAIEKHPDSLMAGAKISGKTAFRCAEKGDAAAKAVVSEYISYLACGIVNIINILQPRVFCIGGGVSNEGDGLFEPLRAAVAESLFDTGGRNTEIRRAVLGNDAGIIGAAMLGKYHWGRFGLES